MRGNQFEDATRLRTIIAGVQEMRHRYPNYDKYIDPRDRLQLHMNLGWLIEECEQWRDQITAPDVDTDTAADSPATQNASLNSPDAALPPA